jgi:PAS domain S-box-containing protein
MAEQMFGYTQEEAIGQSLHHLISLEEAQWIESEALTRFANLDNLSLGGGTIEFEAVHKNNNRLSVELSISSLKLRGQWHAIGIIRDITERKKAELELSESRRMLQLVLDNVPQRIFWKDTESVYMGCNKNLANDFGFTDASEIIGKTDYDLPAKKEDADRYRAEDIAVMRENKPRYHIPDKVVRADNSIAWSENNKIPLHDTDGKVVGVLVTYEDITEKKRAEEEKQKLRAELEKAERMKSLGILAGGIAHDLNNMLGPLVGYSDLILAELEAANPIHKKVKHILRASQDAADVIQDLLAMARRGRYEMKPLKLNDVIREYIESPGYIHKSKGFPNVEVKVDLAENLPNMSGSAPHLMKVVMNLFVNAFDAMPDGGTLTVETSAVWLEKLLSQQIQIEHGEYIIFKVSDTGVGIQPEDINRIFEPYFSKKKLGTSGSGLGLAVVYGIVKDHKGYYDLISQVGHGTSFLIYFPVTGEGVDSIDEKSEELNGYEKILVVDDMPEQCELTLTLLKSFGYEVVTAYNGREAIDYVRENSVDLIIFDMILEEGFDGLDAYKEILKLNPGQKSIIMSGFATTKRVREMQELGAGSYLKKPFSRIGLGRAVKQELDRKSPRPAEALPIS